MRLVERGEFDLDQPLYELLPYPRFGGAPEGKLLTARMVLSHQTGLPNWGDETLSFMFRPGTQFGYSGEAYVYLQRVIEKITARNLQELAQREVFQPLGMKNSYYTWSDNKTPSLVLGHDELGEPQFRGKPEANAASSLHTTASDYARFMLALLNAEGLKRSSISRFFQLEIGMKGDERGAELSPEDASKLGWGLAWGIQRGTDRNLAWHWGDNGVFKSFVVLVPGERSGAVYFANSSNGLAVGQRLLSEYFAEITAAFSWLMYDQTHTPGWQMRHMGAIAESKAELKTAVTYYQHALVQDPNDEQTRRRLDWLNDLIRVREKPVLLSADKLKQYTGRFGPRLITLSGSTLLYQRDGNQPYELIPMSQFLFALKGRNDFRIEFRVGSDNGFDQVIGHYLNGHNDESSRSDTP